MATEKMKRLTKAINRVSRDRYMTPRQFWNFALPAAIRIFSNDGNAHRMLQRQYHAEILTGIFKGAAPFKAGSHELKILMDFLRSHPKHKPINDNRIELFILKQTIASQQNDRNN